MNRVIKIFSKEQLSKVQLTLIVALIASSFEVIGIAMIMPFIDIVSNQSIITESVLHAKIYEFFSIQSYQSYIIIFGCLTLVSILVSSLIVALSKYKITKLIWDLNYQFTEATFLWYLKKDYNFYLKNDTAILSKNIHNEIGILINGFLLPLSKVITNGFTIALVLSLLLYVEPTGVLVVLPIVLISYYLVYHYSHESITIRGKMRLQSHNVMHKILKEVSVGIKNIIINNKYSVFKSIFDKALKEYSSANVVIGVLSELPRYIIEFLMYAIVIVFIIGGVVWGSGLSDTLPTLALFAAASVRVLPYGQQLYSSLTRVKYNYPSFNELSTLLIEINEEKKDSPPLNENKVLPKRYIEMKNINYRYPGAINYVFQGADVKIKLGKWVGLSGYSGAGKSTLLDILMGLLEPIGGSINVDGTSLNKGESEKLRDICAYLPQKSFLFNGTIKQNVAFDYDNNKIDHDRVVYALKQVGLWEFILELPHGVDQYVGDNGVCLSGGQTQRIGIARSLYSLKSILIFDESTSALDSVGENFIFSQLKKIPNITLITVTHDHSILSRCDYILYVGNDGQVLTGTYASLTVLSDEFSVLSKA